MAIGRSGVANYVNTSGGQAEDVNASDEGVGGLGVATGFSAVAYKISAESGGFLTTEAATHLITEQ